MLTRNIFNKFIPCAMKQGIPCVKFNNILHIGSKRLFSTISPKKPFVNIKGVEDGEYKDYLKEIYLNTEKTVMNTLAVRDRKKIRWIFIIENNNGNCSCLFLLY